MEEMKGLIIAKEGCKREASFEVVHTRQTDAVMIRTTMNVVKDGSNASVLAITHGPEITCKTKGWHRRWFLITLEVVERIRGGFMKGMKGWQRV